MKTILKEHEELATRLANELTARRLNDELENVADYYEAADAATIELRNAMYRQYDMDALADVVALFDEVLTAARECGSVSGSLWRNVRDENGEVEGYEQVESWQEADWAEVETEGVNLPGRYRNRIFETFASTVVNRIFECIPGPPFSDEETENDGEYQFFRMRK